MLKLTMKLSLATKKVKNGLFHLPEADPRLGGCFHYVLKMEALSILIIPPLLLTQLSAVIRLVASSNIIQHPLLVQGEAPVLQTPEKKR